MKINKCPVTVLNKRIGQEIAFMVLIRPTSHFHGNQKEFIVQRRMIVSWWWVATAIGDDRLVTTVLIRRMSFHALDMEIQAMPKISEGGVNGWKLGPTLFTPQKFYSKNIKSM